MTKLQEKLNKLSNRLTSEELLKNRGLGNDIGYYIFDYPAEEEQQVRSFVNLTIDSIRHKNSDLNIIHIDLFKTILSYLEDRGLKDKAYGIQQNKGDKVLENALKGPLNATRFSEFVFNDTFKENCDLILITGIGSSWPLLRANELLNNLQSKTGDTPLVLFYPGEYDKQTLKLFGRITSQNYYRAFKLIV